MMMKITSTWGRVAAVALMSVAAAACDTTTEPDAGAPIDLQRAMDDYNAMDAVLASEEWNNFQIFGGKVPTEIVGPVGHAALEAALDLRLPRDAAGTRDVAQTLGAMLEEAALTGAAAPIISERHRGATFVYDATADEYVVDSARTGAPSNGVRFIVYKELSNGKPDPNAEVGHADLVDEGDSSPEDVALRLFVVENGSNTLDYRTTLDGVDSNTGRVTVSGVLSDGTTSLDFQMVAQGNDDALVLEFEMGIKARDFKVVGALRNPKKDTGTVELSVRHGKDSFALDLTDTSGSLDGTVKWNGELLATASGNAKDPTFTSADGDPLTQSETLVLYRIVDVAEDAFDFFEDLIDPMDDIVLLAFIL